MLTSSKLVLKTENGIISPTSWPPIKKLLLQKVYNFSKRIQNWFWKQEIELSKQEMELFLLLSDLRSKNYFTKDLSWLPRFLKMVFKTGNGIIQTGNGIISPISWPLIKKLILQKVSNFYNGVQNWCWKEEMDLSKQEMELFLLFPDHWSNNFFYKILPHSGPTWNSTLFESCKSVASWATKWIYFLTEPATRPPQCFNR